MDLTGCWFNPALDGSGLVIDDAPEARVVYWYTYADGLPSSGGGQLWLIGQPNADDRSKVVFYKPSGKWMGQSYELGEPVAYGELDLDGDRLVFDYRLTRLGPCRSPSVSPVWGGCSGKVIFSRLTRRG